MPPKLLEIFLADSTVLRGGTSFAATELFTLFCMTWMASLPSTSSFFAMSEG
jgi:hypothetical protein